MENQEQKQEQKQEPEQEPKQNNIRRFINNRKPQKRQAETKKIVVNVANQEIRVAIIENGILSEYQVERMEEERQIGNIYKGRVETVLPGIQSAFVDIGLEKNGFLFVTDVYSQIREADLIDENFDLETHKKRVKKNISIEDSLKAGEEILVQVEKDAISTKGVKLTTYLSIPGKFCVLMPNVNHKGISKKIVDREERKRLRDLLSSFKLIKDYGCILRTAAEGKTKRQLYSDMKYFVKIWNNILKQSKKNKAPALLYEERNLIVRIVRDLFTEDVDEFIVDSKDVYNKIRGFLSSTSPELKRKVKLYGLDEPIFSHFNMEHEIQKIYNKKVELKCGGYLVIEETEALVAIDVNTGRHKGVRDAEATILKTNMEAAREIPRQLKLRDVGGIIIIDFIDMKSRENQRKVYNELAYYLKRDKSKTTISQISKMGLLEMTRQRRGKGLYRSLHEICPYCEGTGYIKSVLSISLDVLRTIK
ncbi:Rne/Rng family ribonuclease, partial [bacterium]|nr:Rne/Rng family ribonuclease [bacterium]